MPNRERALEDTVGYAGLQSPSRCRNPFQLRQKPETEKELCKGVDGSEAIQGQTHQGFNGDQFQRRTTMR